jgi:alkylation response protein AidB-like acyl-CoA dehydrogenase
MPTRPRDPQALLASVREFVAKEVIPTAPALEHADIYPHELVARMRELGLFGALVPTEHGGLGLDVTTYARVIEEICRGFMSLAGVLNSHTMAALIVLHHGTDEQRGRLLPRFASGEARGGLCLTEPHAGSDVQAIRTVARRDGDGFRISGSKMFVTNGREGNTFALLALTDPSARPPHKGMSCFIVEKGGPGLHVVKSIAKLGYKGVDTAELLFEDFPVPAANLVGGVPGRGFQHVMSGLETGRINIAARAVGVAQAALDEAVRHEFERAEAKPELADIATRVEAARLLTSWAAGMKDRSERCDLEAGMAKLYASETAQDVAVETMKLMGPAAQSQSGVVERLYRDTPLMIIGEGTNEIQRTIICKNLLQRHGERPGALVSRDGLATELKQMVLLVRQAVEKDIIPAVDDYEPTAHWPGPMIDKFGALGILGMLVPAEYGGLGLDTVTYAMIIEELARGWTTVAGLVASHAIAAHAIARMETPELKERWLSPLTRGERSISLVHAAATTTARKEGAGWVLSGSARLANCDDRADAIVVLARREEGGRSAFFVEGGAGGLSFDEVHQTLGARGLPLRDVSFDRVRAHGGSSIGTLTLALARVADAATAVGLAQAAFEAALRYSQQRSAFGVPICQHQAIQLKLADMATRITAGRLLTYRAAERLDMDPRDDAGSIMARLDTAETAYAVTLEAMRIHGGYGYTREFPVERYYRDASRFLTAREDLDLDRRQLASRLAAKSA